MEVAAVAGITQFTARPIITEISRLRRIPDRLLIAPEDAARNDAVRSTEIWSVSINEGAWRSKESHDGLTDNPRIPTRLGGCTDHP
jgi:hypothetical protein